MRRNPDPFIPVFRHYLNIYMQKVFMTRYKIEYSFASPRLRFLFNSYLILIIFFLITPIICNADTDNPPNLLINNLMHNSTHLPLPQKIEDLSSEFINVSYQFEPLGEGALGQFNKEPLYRFDKFDCQTYVSIILALASAKDLMSFQSNVKLIDYKKGKISFINRNHFVDADWVPQNIHNGFIKDINKQVAGDKVAIATTYINRKVWLQNLPSTRIHIDNLNEQQTIMKLVQLHQLSRFVINERATINYIPMSALFNGPQQLPSDIFNKIPSGAIILIIRPATDLTNLQGTNTAVSHMGFAIRYNNQLFFRAASSYFGKVTDIPLTYYLQHMYSMQSSDGISVYMPTPP